MGYTSLVGRFVSLLTVSVGHVRDPFVARAGGVERAARSPQGDLGSRARGSRRQRFYPPLGGRLWCGEVKERDPVCGRDAGAARPGVDCVALRPQRRSVCGHPHDVRGDRPAAPSWSRAGVCSSGGSRTYSRPASGVFAIRQPASSVNMSYELPSRVRFVPAPPDGNETAAHVYVARRDVAVSFDPQVVGWFPLPSGGTAWGAGERASIPTGAVPSIGDGRTKKEGHIRVFLPGIDPWGVGYIREIGTVDETGLAPDLLKPDDRD
jgi:hypothetical protein